MIIDHRQKLRASAIGLIIAGSLNGMTGLLALLSGLFRLTGIAGKETLPSDQAEKMGFMIGTIVPYMIAFVSLVLAPVIIYGAVQMMQGKKPGLAKIAAILAIVPVTSCCFLIGIPMGIWSLVVPAKPEVKAIFGGEAPDGIGYPPHPPQNW
jgi:uncharacterized BrkB/YihY/UPF0761 family membrane protein